jgi:hypothetical protein
MNFLRLTRCLAVILVMQFPFASFSQERSSATVQLLDRARQLSDDARSLKPLDEIPLQSRLADAVWDFDKSLAERLLLRSFELTVAQLKDSSAVDAASRSADPQILFAQVSAIAAKHDEKLEKKLKERWQEANAPVAEKGSEAKTDPTQLAYLLLTQSASYLKSDEQRARQLFRQSVSHRVLQEHSFFLMGQRKHAPAITDMLFSDTIDILAQRPLAEANEVLVLSAYLFSPDDSLSYVAISGYNTASVAARASAVPKNPALARRYLTLLFSKMTPSEQVPMAVAYFALKNLVPQYQVLAPDLLNDVYAKMANLLPGVSKGDSAIFESAHKGFNASESEATADWEKRIQNADKIANEDRRDREYYTIVFGYLLPKKDFTRATLLASRVNNQELKEKMSDLVNLTVLQANLEKPETTSLATESDCNKLKIPLVRNMALSSLGKARLKEKATGDALRLFGQAIAEADKIKEDQDRLQAKLMLVQLFMDVNSSSGFERAAEAFKAINHFSDFNMNRSYFAVKVTVYGMMSEEPVIPPAQSSLVSTVAKMCRLNCEETFQVSGLLEKKELRLWATFVAVQTGLRESSKEARQ